MAWVWIPARFFPAFRRSAWLASLNPPVAPRTPPHRPQGGSWMQGPQLDSPPRSGRRASSSRRGLALALTVAAALIALPAAAGAAPHHAAATSGPTIRHNPHGKFLGVVPTRQLAKKAGPAANGNLDYNGGPVMHSLKAYVIYWQPSGTYIPPSYRALIEQQLKDVGADSFKASNQWGVEEQYFDKSGPGGTNHYLETNFSFGKSFVDTHAFPANGCTDSATAKCLNDNQLRAELQSFMAAHGLKGGLDKEYFLLTPPNIGSCSASGGPTHAFTHCFADP